MQSGIPAGADYNQEMSKLTAKSIYLHIPFCKSKCSYCSFVSFAGKENLIHEYFVALNQEVKQELKLSLPPFETVYIGGGTPSLADSKYYKELLSIIPLSNNAEITIEVNPGTVTQKYLESLLSIGINRLSIGVQCFDDDILKVLNRPHTAQDAIDTVKWAQNAGFKNISIDLIYGLPYQTLNGWLQTLQKALELNVQHISAYGLKIEEGTKLTEMPAKNFPTEDETVEMYLKTIKILENNGYNHYEISNFSKRGYESRHNLTYWENKQYYGFGLSAHGYINGIRYSNTSDLSEYLHNPLQKSEEKLLTQAEIQEEALFLGLRLRQGVDITPYNGKYDKIFEKYTNLGMMELKNNTLRLTVQGVLLSNNILAEFLE